jgi:hypothetical protein
MAPLWGKIPYVIGFGLAGVAADGPKETSDPISEARGMHPRQAWAKTTACYYYAPQKCSHIGGRRRNLPGQPSCSRTGFVGWRPLASTAPGTLVWGFWRAVTPLGWLWRIGLGRIEEFRTFPWRECPNGL